MKKNLWLSCFLYVSLVTYNFYTVWIWRFWSFLVRPDHMVLLTLCAISWHFVRLLCCIWLSILGTERRALGFFWLPFQCLMVFKLNILSSFLLFSLLQHNFVFPSFARLSSFYLFIYLILKSYMMHILIVRLSFSHFCFVKLWAAIVMAEALREVFHV